MRLQIDAALPEAAVLDRRKLPSYGSGYKRGQADDGESLARNPRGPADRARPGASPANGLRTALAAYTGLRSHSPHRSYWCE